MTPEEKIKSLEAELSPVCGVYLIVSPSNGRYVGSSRSLKKRFNRYKNCSCKSQSAILSSLKKYGFENHKLKILYYCQPEELLFWERVFADIYLASANFPNGLTIQVPGYDDKPCVKSDELKKRISDIQKNRFSDPQERIKTSETTKLGFTDKVKERMKKAGSHVWDENRRSNKSEEKLKYYSDEENRKKTSDGVKKFLSENPEVKEKCLSALNTYYSNNPNARSEAAIKIHKENPSIGKAHSDRMREHYKNNPEARIRASEKTKKQFANRFAHPHGIRIVDTATGNIYASIKHCSEHIGVAEQTLRNKLRGKSPNNTNLKFLN